MLALAALSSLMLSQAPAAPPAAPAAKPKPVQILLLDLSAIDVSPDKVKLLTGKLASSMGARGLEVVTRSDIRTMASLEADKIAAGCDENSQSCLAEIASALGTRLVLSGQVGSLDSTIFLQISLFDSEVGKAVAREEARGSSLSQIADSIPGLVDRVLTPVLGEPAAAAAPAASAPLPVMTIAGGALAAVGVVGTVAFGTWAAGLEGDLASETAPLEAKQFAFDNGRAIFGLAAASVLVAGGGAALLVLGLTSE